jgi:hypothetical protein
MKWNSLHLRRALVCFALFFGVIGGYWGQSAGFNNTFIILSLNGGANTYYDLKANTSNIDFNGANLGTFTAGSSNLILKGAEHNVYKCGGADLTSTRLQYQIYLTASSSGSFTPQIIGYTSGGANGCGGQDQQWSNASLTTNLLTGLSAGSYTIEVYSDATVTCCGGTVSASNSGNNYKATFEIAQGPSITSTSSSVTSNSTQTYAGATITINGTNLSAVTSVKIGGSSGTSCSISSVSSSLVNAVIPNGTQGGVIWVSDGTVSSTSSETFSNLGYISTADSDWNTTTTWLGGAVPPAGSAVTINHALTVNGSVSNAPSSVTINSSKSLTFGSSGALMATTIINNGGSLVMTAGGTLTIASGGTLANGTSTFTYGSGTVAFAGSGIITGTIGFNNVTIAAGGVNFGSTSTINGTLTFNNSSGSVSTAPTYANTSLLLYNSGGVFNRGVEWNAISGPGYPNDVQVSSNTTLNVPNTSGAFSTNMAIARDLTIDAGASLYMDYGAGAASGSLTVGRDISIAGNLSLGDAVGGDLNVGRNWTHTTGIFNANLRAVTFNGATGDQIISNSNGETFPYLTINKTTSGGITLSCPVTVSNTLTLTKGLITTTSSNILHITNSSSSAMSGGSSTSFISGPLRWSVSNSSGGDYKFHVGKSATYLPINVNNPTGTTPVITAEAFTSNAGGSAGAGLVNISSSEYWTLINTGTLSSATVSLAKTSLAGNDGVGYSSTLAGTYAGLGGSNASTLISNNTVTATSSVGSLASTTYFVLATKVPAPTISSFTPSSVYVGSTITITGTNFTNVSAVSIGGVAATSYTVNSSTSISATVAASAVNGTISVTTPGGTATSSSTFTLLGYVSAAATDWNTTSTWLGGAVPPSSATVTIDHAVTINGTVTNAPSSVTINNSKSLTFGASGALTATSVTNNGSLIMSAGGTLNIASGGTLANGSNTFTFGAGTVAFAGSGTVTGTIGFNNVTIAGAVNFGTTATMNGILTINAGGAINTNAPNYASGSTLKYNSGNTYGRYLEWNATSGAGYPHHVQVSNNTTLNVTNASHVARQIAGNLTVDAGSTLSMEGMTIASPTEIGLTIGGNILNYGTITVSSSTERIKCIDFTNNTGATTTLSSAIGGDLEVTGSFVDNGTYNANARAIFFTGTGTQNISGTGTFDIDYMVMNKASGEVVMLNDLKCQGPNGGYAITLTNNTDVLNLNGHDIVFGISGVSSSATGSGKLKGDVNSNITILGTGSFGTLNFDNSYNTIGSLTLNRTSTGSFGLGSNLVVSGTLTLTEGALSIGAYSLECQNAVNVSSGTIKGSSSSTLILSGGNSTAELKMDNTTPGTTNLLGALTLSKTGVSSAVNITANVIVNGALSISGDGTNTLSASKQLTVNGTLTNNGILTLNSGATLVQGTSSAIAGSGTYNVKQTITGSGGSTPNGRFWYLGSPLSNGLSSALLSSTGNQLWQWNESSFAYATVSTGQALTQGKSYVLRSGQNETINFSGTSLSNGTVTVSGLTRTGTSQQFRGCHLISNPYPSYLDWNSVTKTNIGTTMYVRTAVNTTYDILETFNSTGSVATNNSGTPLTQYIAPMQGFWVKVSADNLTGSLTMNNSMRSHQASGSGLRSTAQDFPAFLRFNMIDGQNKDQVILLMSPDASMSLDAFDSEKMSATGYAQFYSTVNATKLVINGMKNVKAKTSVPLTLVMPTSKSYTFQAEEFNIEDGLILLEDKQEGVIQDLTINPTYSFFGNAGTNATRFVVHFQLATAPVLVGGPQELESLGSDELMSDNIQIVSNNQGTVIIRLDEGFKPEGSIRIFDASGRLVEQRDFNDQEKTIQLNEQAGMYFVEVSAGKLMVKRKIVIE